MKNYVTSLHSLSHHVTKYKLDMKNYVLPNLDEKCSKKLSNDTGSLEECIADSNLNINKTSLYAFPRECVNDVPKLCTYSFMNRNELLELLKLNKYRDVKEAIKTKTNSGFPMGPTKIVLNDLMYSVTKFCIKSQFHVEQVGSMLGIVYFTHRYFCGNLNVTPREVYDHFVKFLLLHTVDLPPDSIEYFSLEESRKIILYFCNLYLRFLPLIRIVCLPNFALSIDYKLEPEPVKIKSAKNKKDKKNKNKNKKNKKKK